MQQCKRDGGHIPSTDLGFPWLHCLWGAPPAHAKCSRTVSWCHDLGLLKARGPCPLASQPRARQRLRGIPQLCACVAEAAHLLCAVDGLRVHAAAAVATRWNTVRQTQACATLDATARNTPSRPNIGSKSTRYLFQLARVRTILVPACGKCERCVSLWRGAFFGPRSHAVLWCCSQQTTASSEALTYSFESCALCVDVPFLHHAQLRCSGSLKRQPVTHQCLCRHGCLRCTRRAVTVSREPCRRHRLPPGPFSAWCAASEGSSTTAHSVLLCVLTGMPERATKHCCHELPVSLGQQGTDSHAHAADIQRHCGCSREPKEAAVREGPAPAVPHHRPSSRAG